MATKTITITEDAYEMIKRLKHEGESFSDLFKRLGSTRARVSDIMGILKHTPKEADEFARRVKDIHEELGKGFARRIDNVHARFKHTH
jgi:predicted CopG family antitoxin